MLGMSHEERDAQLESIRVASARLARQTTALVKKQAKQKLATKDLKKREAAIQHLTPEVLEGVCLLQNAKGGISLANVNKGLQQVAPAASKKMEAAKKSAKKKHVQQGKDEYRAVVQELMPAAMGEIRFAVDGVTCQWGHRLAEDDVVSA
jgi:hypothetical protein